MVEGGDRNHNPSEGSITLIRSDGDPGTRGRKLPLHPFQWLTSSTPKLGKVCHKACCSPNSNKLRGTE